MPFAALAITRHVNRADFSSDPRTVARPRAWNLGAWYESFCKAAETPAVPNRFGATFASRVLGGRTTRRGDVGVFSSLLRGARGSPHDRRACRSWKRNRIRRSPL